MSETFLLLIMIHRDIINVRRSPCEIPVNSCQVSMKLEFPRHIFENFPNVSHENPSIGSHSVLSGHTDRLDEADSRFAVFRMRLKRCTIIAGDEMKDISAVCLIGKSPYAQTRLFLEAMCAPSKGAGIA